MHNLIQNPVIIFRERCNWPVFSRPHSSLIFTLEIFGNLHSADLEPLVESAWLGSFPEVRKRKGTETGLLDPTITGWRPFLLHYFCSPSLFLSLASLVCPQHHHFQPKTLQARCLLLKVMHALWFFSKQLFFTRSPGRRRCWAKHRTFTGQCFSSGWVLVCSWAGARKLCPGQLPEANVVVSNFKLRLWSTCCLRRDQLRPFSWGVHFVNTRSKRRKSNSSYWELWRRPCGANWVEHGMDSRRWLSISRGFIPIHLLCTVISVIMPPPGCKRGHNYGKSFPSIFWEVFLDLFWLGHVHLGVNGCHRKVCISNVKK